MISRGKLRHKSQVNVMREREKKIIREMNKVTIYVTLVKKEEPKGSESPSGEK